MTTTVEAPFAFKIGPDGLPVFEPETATMDPNDPFAQERAAGVIALQLDPNVTIHQEEGEVFARRGSTYIPLPPGLVVGRAFNGEHAENSVGLLWEALNPYVIGSDGDVLPIVSSKDLQSSHGYAFEARTVEGSLHLADPDPLRLGTFPQFKSGYDLDGEFTVAPQYQDSEQFDWFKASQPPPVAPVQGEAFNWFNAATPAPETATMPNTHVPPLLGALAAAEQVLGYRPVTLADLETAAV